MKKTDHLKLFFGKASTAVKPSSSTEVLSLRPTTSSSHLEQRTEAQTGHDDIHFINDDSSTRLAINSIDTSSGTKESENVKNKAPAQDQLRMQISTLESDLTLLHQLKSSGMITDDQEKLLKEKTKQLFQFKNDLKKKESNMIRQKKSRDNKKKVIDELII